ncbi:MAG: hypothetical protein WA294_13625 [Acidobacteriaceae bacterium]
MDLKDFLARWRRIWTKADESPAEGTASGGGAASAGSAGAGAGSTPSSSTPSAVGRTLLIHGYSAKGEDLIPWHDALKAAGITTTPIAVGNYITLNNEVTIKDLGEAFDRALRFTPWSSGSKDDQWTFDAVVHSTGMLVLRQWLTSDPYPRGDSRSRIRRLKHLVGLAPATFGSPQANQGRSWLGALVKGNKHLGPDFLNAGNQVLDGLELGSRYTWELTHKDMVCATPLYGKGPDTPYVTVFIGNIGYQGIDAVANSPGSDGTVRWAGCALNTRKVSVDLRREPRLTDDSGKPLVDANGIPMRCNITPWETNRLAAPMIAVDGKNHGSIVENPAPGVIDRMKRFFGIADAAAYDAWEKDALAWGQAALDKMNAESRDGANGGAGWQQLVVHAVDDHGDGVADYNLQLYIGDNLDQSDDPAFPAVQLIVDTYSGDSSYRCFYIRLTPDMLALNTPGGQQKKMWLELIASSGSNMIEYEAYTGQPDDPQPLTVDHTRKKPVKLDLTPLAQGDQTLLYPYTTTLLEVFVEREPMPLGTVSQLFNFLPKTI